MAKLLPFSDKCANLLRNPPAPGEGRHQWLFKVAVTMCANGYKPEKVREFLDRVCDYKGWHDRKGKTLDDIFSKIDAGLLPTDMTRLPEWPEPNNEERRARFSFTPMFDANQGTGLTAPEVLSKLYRPDEYVCFGWSKYRYSTMPLEDMINAAPNAEFIVANPMTAEMRDDGSKRNKQIASRPEDRRYAIIEFDTGETREQQAAVLSSLHGSQTPLVLAVWSGGKSIHGWFNVRALSPYHKLYFFRYARWLGADHSLYDMAKLVRMPGGQRDGTPQTILYWEPEHL